MSCWRSFIACILTRIGGRSALLSSLYELAPLVIYTTLLTSDRYGFQVVRGRRERPVVCTIVALQQADHLTRKLLSPGRIQRLEGGDQRAIVRSKVFQPVRSGAIAEDKLSFRRLERGNALAQEVAQPLLGSPQCT